MDIFAIKDGELIINRPDFALYPALATILRRDKDRFKKQAFRELAYIFITTDPNAVPFKNGYNESETHSYALDIAKLPEDWKPDSEVKAAIKEYQHLNSNAIKEVIRESLIAFRNYAKVTKLIRKHIDKILDQAEENDLGVDEINKLISYSEQLINLGNAIPQVKDKLNASLLIVERTMDLETDEDLVRGTTEKVPMSFEPNSDFGGEQN